MKDIFITNITSEFYNVIKINMPVIDATFVNQMRHQNQLFSILCPDLIKKQKVEITDPI